MNSLFLQQGNLLLLTLRDLAKTQQNMFDENKKIANLPYSSFDKILT